MATVQAVATTARTQQENQLVTFYLGNEEFGFDIMSVQEIIREPALSRVPMAPEYVEGVANLRGTILPVIDTRTRLGMARQEDTDSTRVLVIEVEGTKTGLRVDRVRQVTRIDANDVEPPPATIRSAKAAGFIRGLVKLEGGNRIILALSPEAVSELDPCDATETSKSAWQDGHERSESDASAGARNESQSVTQVVSFKLGQEEFAFPMECVREILRMQRPSEVPDTPDSCLGILTVRGNILPVIDLRLLLGLRALSVELEAASAQVRNEYELWLAALASHIADGSSPNPGTSGPDALRSWISSLSTSSESLLDVLSCMRAANDKAFRGWQQLGGTHEAESRQLRFDREIAPHALDALRQIRSLQSKIVANIHEDQRVIVVEAEGAPFALVVDRVREVLTVPTGLLDSSRRLGKSRDGSKVRSIARLDGGKRLIVLLDAVNLLRGLDAVKQAVAAFSSAPPPVSDSSQGPSSRKTDASGERQYVVFRLEDGEYGIPISDIQEIDRCSKTTRIPTSADYVDGITNLRGEVIPVINARRRLHLPEKQLDERARVIMIDVKGEKTGLRVDSVREVLNLRERDIAPPPASVCQKVDRRFVEGIGKVNGGERMIVLLNAARLIEAEVE